MEKKCPNCDTALADEIKFCPQCGQKTKLHRLTMQEVLHEMVHYFTHANKSFPSLLKALFIKNGLIAREYLAGKRKKYFPPLNFFLLVATIFVFIATLTNPPRATVESILNSHPEVRQIPDAAKREHVTGIYLRANEVGIFMSKYANIVAMVATPIICFIYWLFYRRTGYTYTEHLVACFYMVGFGNLVYVVLFIPLTSVLGRNVGYVFLGLQALYNSVYYYNFINRRSAGARFKAFAVSFLSVALWGVLINLLIMWYIRMGWSI